MQIGRRASGDRRVDVGDRHHHLDIAVGQRLGHRQLIEVARIVVVNRTPEQQPQVPRRSNGRLRGPVQSGDLRDYLRGKVRVESVDTHRLDRDGAQAGAIRLRRGRAGHDSQSLTV